MIENSIIIPTAFAKREELLQPCIESIQKFTDLDTTEIIVVANGCTDDTLEYSEANGCKVVMWPRAIGYPAAINSGVESAQGEFIIPFNNDNILLEQPRNQWIEILRQPFGDPRTAVSGPMKEFCPWAEYHFILFFCTMIRKSVFEQLGGLDEIFTPGIGEDTDFCCKVQRAGHRITQVPDDDDYRFYDHNRRLGNFPIFHAGTKTFQHLGDANDCAIAGIQSYD